MRALDRLVERMADIRPPPTKRRTALLKINRDEIKWAINRIMVQIRNDARDPETERLNLRAGQKFAIKSKMKTHQGDLIFLNILVVKHEKDPSGRVSGLFARTRRRNEPVILLKVPAGEYDEDGLARNLRFTLTHELTHAKDLTPPTLGNPQPGKWGQYFTYISSPSEVTAYLQQVFVELNTPKAAADAVKMAKAGKRPNDWAKKWSLVWKETLWAINKQAKRRFLKAIANLWTNHQKGVSRPREESMRALDLFEATVGSVLRAKKGEDKIKVDDWADFASGQEPDDSDDEFVTLMEIEVLISGRPLAQLLGKQQRVMVRAVRGMTPKQWMVLLTQRTGPVQKEVLKQAKRAAQRTLVAHADEKLKLRGAKVTSVNFADAQDLFRVRKLIPFPDARGFSAEVDVLGKWIR